MTVLAFYTGMTIGAIAAVAVMALLVTAKRSDERMKAPQEPEDLLDAGPDNFDKKA